MRRLSAAGQATMEDIARRHGFSSAAVSSMLASMLAGQGRMAQFDQVEFGGSGQWMRGGMTMVSDMFNATLKGRVQRLCDELSELLVNEPSPLFASEQDDSADRAAGRDRSFFATAGQPEGDWWPADFGRPSSVGAQNGTRYAYFPAAHRLALYADGRITLYDTLDHRITGVAQQQPGRGSLLLTSQHGGVDISTLPVVSTASRNGIDATHRRAAEVGAANGGEGAEPDVLTIIEKLADLHGKGILSAAEFSEKKAELLSRL